MNLGAKPSCERPEFTFTQIRIASSEGDTNLAGLPNFTTVSEAIWPERFLARAKAQEVPE
ncbi:MAG: hypothetical protein A2V89_01730 [Gammaproteobacteria bacterium RBG_16_37_9]|nr:MAG: hypothetical protein A2V89_01730 [Gammaproteobacteria bacterium RBG_16_37_9]